ncbi:hypothetical protein ENBRE01_1772 [Enteropsectra breve]|nr:hypothetical protein ENBRE01_1772 [Enteropsectra breve]
MERNLLIIYTIEILYDLNKSIIGKNKEINEEYLSEVEEHLSDNKNYFSDAIWIILLSKLFMGLIMMLCADSLGMTPAVLFVSRTIETFLRNTEGVNFIFENIYPRIAKIFSSNRELFDAGGLIDKLENFSDLLMYIRFPYFIASVLLAMLAFSLYNILKWVMIIVGSLLVSEKILRSFLGPGVGPAIIVLGALPMVLVKYFALKKTWSLAGVLIYTVLGSCYVVGASKIIFKESLSNMSDSNVLKNAFADGGQMLQAGLILTNLALQLLKTVFGRKKEARARYSMIQSNK